MEFDRTSIAEGGIAIAYFAIHTLPLGFNPNQMVHYAQAMRSMECAIWINLKQHSNSVRSNIEKYLKGNKLQTGVIPETAPTDLAVLGKESAAAHLYYIMFLAAFVRAGVGFGPVVRTLSAPMISYFMAVISYQNCEISLWIRLPMIVFNMIGMPGMPIFWKVEQSDGRDWDSGPNFLLPKCN